MATVGVRGLKLVRLSTVYTADRQTSLRPGVRLHQKWSHGWQANMRADVSMRPSLARSNTSLWPPCFSREIFPTTFYRQNRQRCQTSVNTATVNCRDR